MPFELRDLMIAGVSFVFGAAILAAVLLLGRLRASQPAPRVAKPKRPKGKQAAILEMDCTECGNALAIPVAGLQALSGVEKGMVVRSRKDLVGVGLAGYDCPFCEAAHCFRTSPSPVEWVGVNFYAPHQRGRRCYECGKNAFEHATPKTEVQGLECTNCYERFTGKKVSDGSYLCPRCGRGPIWPNTGNDSGQETSAALQGF